MEKMPFALSLLPTVLGLCGIALAYYMYMLRPDVPAIAAARFRVAYELLLNKWYVDDIYEYVFIGPYKSLAAFLWQTGDARIIDGVPNGLASLTEGGSGRAVRLQTGSLAAYAFTMVIGVVVLVAIYLVVR